MSIPYHNHTNRDHLHWLAEEYFSLNGSHIEVLDEPPSALEFSRLVHVSRPVVIRGVKIPASEELWTDDYLMERMGDQQISIALTPNGHADAITTHSDGVSYFTEPHVQLMTLSEFLPRLSNNPTREDSPQEISYLQSQNGNVYRPSSFEDEQTNEPSEFEPLREDIPREIDWCAEAFGKHPDAVNLWMGDSRSVTSIHSDPYENIYTVVRGTKHFLLLPPSEGLYLQEKLYPHAIYTRAFSESRLILTPSAPGTPRVRWSSVLDPRISESLPSSAHPLHITIHAGETLYLPAGWWHHVSQTGRTIALNWWFDMEMRGMSWVMLSFFRRMSELPDDEDVDEDVS